LEQLRTRKVVFHEQLKEEKERILKSMKFLIDKESEEMHQMKNQLEWIKELRKLEKDNFQKKIDTENQRRTALSKILLDKKKIN